MIAIRANLVAGECHEKYLAGSSMAAMIFVGADSDAAAEEIATRELTARDWATMEIERFKDITDYSQFHGGDTPVNGAFQDALDDTFSRIGTSFHRICAGVHAAPGAAGALPTEQAAATAAKVAWRGKFSPATVKEREPYHAELADGTWHVFGTLPAGWRGGTPEALICASDGKVLTVFHGR